MVKDQFDSEMNEKDINCEPVSNVTVLITIKDRCEKSPGHSLVSGGPPRNMKHGSCILKFTDLHDPHAPRSFVRLN